MDIQKYSALQVQFDARNKQVQWLEQMKELIKQGKEIDQYLHHTAHVNQFCFERSLKEIDRRFWHEAFKLTGLSQYMDAKEHKKLEQSMQEIHMPFTPENVKATLMRVAGDSEMMFLRGLYELFRNLSGNYRSHDAFKIKDKMIINYFKSEYSTTLDYYKRDTINDLDRITKTIQGKQYKPWDLVSEIEEKMKVGEPFETDDFTVKVFKNRNAHIVFKDKSMINKVNKLIAEYAGKNTLAKAA